ncbi:hypothetical protein [Propioniciclava soli]|uniref:Uncharacterized protein n=1 Tax=Propioniciclava soli TaxID=2775081 RepID=A0ABZ3C354_9ACTN|nr:hypothetical protein [Propioniciclava soli]
MTRGAVQLAGLHDLERHREGGRLAGSARSAGSERTGATVAALSAQEATDIEVNDFASHPDVLELGRSQSGLLALIPLTVAMTSSRA